MTIVRTRGNCTKTWKDFMQRGGVLTMRIVGGNRMQRIEVKSISITVSGTTEESTTMKLHLK